MALIATAFRPSQPAAVLLAMACASAAQAGPAEDVAALLQGSDVEAAVAYDSVVETEDGGVEIHNLQLTRAALRAMGAAGPLDIWEEPAPGMEPPEYVITVDTVRLNGGTIAVLFGMEGREEPESIAFGLAGYRIDLAALSDLPALTQMRDYVGTDVLTGWTEVAIGLAAAPVYPIAITLDLGAVGRFDMDIEIDEGGGLPFGSMTFSDTAGRGLAGLMAYIQRAPVEMTRQLAEQALQDAREHPLGSTEAQDPIIALLEAEAEAATEMLARFPEDGPAAAEAMAAWAEEMAVRLPEYADFFAAIGAFAQTSGTLTLLFAPADGAEVPVEAAFELPFYSDAEVFSATLDALGITAEFEPAG